MALVNSGNEEKDFENKLKKKIEVHFDMLRNHPRLPFLLFNEISTNPKKIEEYKVKLADMPSLLLESLDKELEKQARLGNIIKIQAIDLLITIISMNAIMFVASPIFKALTNTGEKEYEMMLDKRRSLNVEIILKYLKP